MGLFGGAPAGGAPFAGGPTVDLSSEAPFALILSDPDAERIHILRATVRDLALDEDVVVLYSDREWIGDVPVPVRLEKAVDIESSLGFSGISGVSSPQVGTIRLLGQSEPSSDALDIDFLGSLDWPDRKIEILMGGPTFAFSQFQPVFVGRAVDLVRDELGSEITIADPRTLLQVPFSETYGGGGQEDGDDAVVGITKPYAAGRPKNIEPILIDRTNRIYQWSDRASVDLLVLYERGVPSTDPSGLTRDADTADLWGGTPPIEGHFRVDPSISAFQLGVEPSGRITLDVQGDNVGGFVDLPGEIIDRILRDRGGLVDADIDNPTFAQLDIDLPYAISLYVKPDAQDDVRDVVESLAGAGSDAAGVPAGFLDYTRQGQIAVDSLRFRTPSFVIESKNIVTNPDEEVTASPIKRWTLGYDRAWTVQDVDALSTAEEVTDAFRAFAGQEFRKKIFEDLTLDADHVTPGEVTLDSLIDSGTDAQAEVNRLGALTNVPRQLCRLGVRGFQYRIRRGMTITIQWDPWGMDQDAIVFGVGESSITDETTLLVWM